MAGNLNRFISATPIFAASLLLPLLAGCGESTLTVTGLVKLENKVLSAGTVTFENAEKKAVKSSIISKDGSYSVAMPAGKCKITVTVPPTGDMPGGVTMDPSKMGAAGKVEVKGTEVIDVPAKYKDMKSTPLSFAVEPGQTTFNIEMKADAKVEP